MTRPRLMVVDDEPDMSDFVCAVAQAEGFETFCLHRGKDFITAADQDPDVLVLDLFMPDVDGIELIRLLGQRRFRSPVILMSGVDKNVLHSAHELATELGLRVAGSLNKPFRKNDLAGLLSALREDCSQPEAPPQADAETEIGESDLRLALERRELIPYFQPQLEMGSRRIVAAEALVRWHSPERGVVLPGRFIPLAEYTGIVEDIDDQVLTHAVVQCRAWHDASIRIRVSINVSPATLKDLTFPDRLAALLQGHRLEPGLLSLEITESHVMEDLSRSLDILTRFRMKGFGLSIDDFGTGYSSLEKLARIPFTELKIDRSFVRQIHNDRTCQTIARLSIMLAHELDMIVVGEGIETQEQWDTLAAMGCDIGQGYWLGRPAPAEDCLARCEHRGAASRDEEAPGDHS